MGRVIVKQTAIDELVDNMDNWTQDDIWAFAKQEYRKILEKTKIKELESIYNMDFNGYDSDDEYKYYTKVINTKAAKILFKKKG